MRVLLGMILGAALTIGVAYLHDTGTVASATTASTTTVDQRNMVNWEVVQYNWRHVMQRVNGAWENVSQKMSG